VSISRREKRVRARARTYASMDPETFQRAFAKRFSGLQFWNNAQLIVDRFNEALKEVGSEHRPHAKDVVLGLLRVLADRRLVSPLYASFSPQDRTELQSYRQMLLEVAEHNALHVVFFYLETTKAKNCRDAVVKAYEQIVRGM
jgi:hypothetical protein